MPRGRGVEIDRSSWPESGPHRDLLQFLDQLHRKHGLRSLRVVAQAMSIDSPTRVSHLLRGRNGVLPADEAQVRELVIGLGGTPRDETRAVRLYKLAKHGRTSSEPTQAVGVVETFERAPVPQQLPGSIPDFVGRVDELDQISDIVAEAGERTLLICAVDGTAGVGKTTTAIHWAHAVKGEFPDGQLYVNLRGFDPSGEPLSSHQALEVLLEPFMHGKPLPQGTDARSAELRSQLASRRLLIILDNARNAEQVRSLLPGNTSCVTIVTSRNQLTGLVVTQGARLITLSLMTIKESHDLLVTKIGEDRVAVDEDATANIIKSCARLPLALSIVGAIAAARPTMPLAKIAADLRERLECRDLGAFERLLARSYGFDRRGGLTGGVAVSLPV